MTPVTLERILTKFKIEIAARRGSRWWALCPYHDDHDASWFIRASGERIGQHHCFSCKKGGHLQDLVKRKMRFGSDEAAKEWLEAFTLEEAPPPPVTSVSVRLNVGVRSRFSLPNVNFAPLEDWPSPAREYLRGKGGGVTAMQVARWRLGYAVSGPLEGRIVIPVWGPRGELYGYMARAFDDREPRYKYPPLEKHPHLDIPFGVQNFPPAALRRQCTLYVEEGALNALAVERAIAGRGYIAAMGSSDVRAGHLSVFASFGEVVCVTDPDPAGDAAALALESGLHRHTKFTRVRLPVGEDAKSLPLEELVTCLSKRS